MGLPEIFATALLWFSIWAGAVVVWTYLKKGDASWD